MTLRRISGIATLLLLGGCGSAPAPEPVVVPRESRQVVATDPRVGELQVLVAELLDRLEVVNSRLERLEQLSAEGQPVGPTGAGSRGQMPPSAQPSVTAAQPPAQERLTAAEIGERYKQALEMYGKGQIDRARAAFETVLGADPNGDLADNALYWIGETWYSTGRYPEAIAAYQRIGRDYPGENKAPDALLKMGMSYARAGDLVLARRTYESLIEQYPYSTAAGAARTEIERITY